MKGWEKMKVNNRHCSFYYEMDEDIGAIEINKKKLALLIIDMQNYFVKRPEIDTNNQKEVLNAKNWEPFYKKIDEVVIPNNVKILEEFRKQGLLVSHARITSQLSNGLDRSIDQKATGFNELLLPKGEKESEIIDELTPIKDEIVVMKTTDSALTGTNLRLALSNCGIDTVVVTGVFTDQCVSGTVRSLADESFNVWLIEDACMAGNEEIQNHELSVLNNIYCHVINTKELLAALR